MRNNCFSKKKFAPPPPGNLFSKNVLKWHKTRRKHDIFHKFITNSNNILSISKNYTAHPHNMDGGGGGVPNSVFNKNKASPEISREQVQKLTPQF